MKVVIVVPTNRPKDWQNILENIKRQTHQPIAVIAIENGEHSGWTHGATHSISSGPDVGLARQAGLILAKEKYPGSFFVMMDGDDYYGPSYIEEAYSNKDKADVIGKQVVFYRFNATGVFGLVQGSENKKSEMIHGPTMAGRTDLALDFEACNGWGEDMKWLDDMRDAGRSIYATSRFNFCGVRNKNLDDHTWTMPERAVSKTMAIKDVLLNVTNTNWEDIINNKVPAEYGPAPKFALNIPDLL